MWSHMKVQLFSNFLAMWLQVTGTHARARTHFTTFFFLSTVRSTTIFPKFSHTLKWINIESSKGHLIDTSSEGEPQLALDTVAWSDSSSLVFLSTVASKSRSWNKITHVEIMQHLKSQYPSYNMCGIVNLSSIEWQLDFRLGFTSNSSKESIYAKTFE